MARVERHWAGWKHRPKMDDMTNTAEPGPPVFNSRIASGDSVLTAALHAATRAPSPHNTQPWRFGLSRGDSGDLMLDLMLDEARILPVCDPDGREAVLSCGAALFNLRVALASRGRACAVHPLPDRDKPWLLATVHVGGMHQPTEEQRRLAEAIDHRHTNRRPLLDHAVAAQARRTLVHAAAEESARLVLLDEPWLFDAFAALLRRADHLQSEDPRFAAELTAWTHAGDRADGVPYSAGGPRAASEAPLTLRDFGGGPGRVRREFERQPLVAVLTTPTDTRRDVLHAGQAVQRVLLAATAVGLQASFLSQPFEVPAIRVQVRTLLGRHEYPQTALRIGHGYPGSPTPRRSLAEVVSETQDEAAPIRREEGRTR